MSNIAVDKKTKKLLALLEKEHLCRVEIANKKNTIYVFAPDTSVEPYNIHVGHKISEKTFHPLRRWANNTFNLKLV